MMLLYVYKMCVCVIMCVRVYDLHVDIRGQCWVSIDAKYIAWNEVSLILTTIYTRLAFSGASKDSIFTSHHTRTAET